MVARGSRLQFRNLSYTDTLLRDETFFLSLCELSRKKEGVMLRVQPRPSSSESASELDAAG